MLIFSPCQKLFPTADFNESDIHAKKYTRRAIIFLSLGKDPSGRKCLPVGFGLIHCIHFSNAGQPHLLFCINVCDNFILIVNKLFFRVFSHGGIEV